MQLQLPPEFGFLPMECAFAETPSASAADCQPVPTPHTPAPPVFEGGGWLQAASCGSGSSSGGGGGGGDEFDHEFDHAFARPERAAHRGLDAVAHSLHSHHAQHQGPAQHAGAAAHQGHAPDGAPQQRPGAARAAPGAPLTRGAGEPALVEQVSWLPGGSAPGPPPYDPVALEAHSGGMPPHLLAILHLRQLESVPESDDEGCDEGGGAARRGEGGGGAEAEEGGAAAAGAAPAPGGRLPQQAASGAGALCAAASSGGGSNGSSSGGSGAVQGGARCVIFSVDDSAAALSPESSNGGGSGGGVIKAQQAEGLAMVMTDLSGSWAVAAVDEWEEASKVRLSELQQQEAAAAGAAARVEPAALAAQAGGTAAIPAAEARAALVAAAESSPERRAAAAAAAPAPPACSCMPRRAAPRGGGAAAAARGGLPPLAEQRRQLLALARVALDWVNPLHRRIMAGLFLGLAGRPPPAEGPGPHWLELGFQGPDPATDLRGCGMLGALQLLALPQVAPAQAAALVRLSRSGDQEFPLAVVGLNLTAWCLAVLRRGALGAAARRRHGRDLAAAADAFCLGAWAAFDDAWRGGGATMRVSGHVLARLSREAAARPGRVAARGAQLLAAAGG
ncbi:MAG: ELMO/CED-12 family-domain-containing protein [Monoraphidium minutum]|nr:MAG: ELMO/CED-12 family-domain-containing protein [Monoraphidium minutum]